MIFKINNHKWEIVLHDTKRMRELVSEIENRDIGFVYGYTYYPCQIILINSDCNDETMVTTLKHELTHCYLWSYGFREVKYNLEIICDIVANSNDFINEIIEKFKKTITK